MDLLIAVLLIAAAIGQVVGMVIDSLRRRRRSNALGQAAYGRHMRFAVEDPLDIPGRYRRFAAMLAGHDVCARNVCDASSDLGRARTFDLLIHVGRGGGRRCRRYAAAVIELAGPADVPGESARGDVDGFAERVDRCVLACVPMGRPPQDHGEALILATRHVASGRADRPGGKC